MLPVISEVATHKKHSAKIGVLKSFANFTVKRLCWRLFFITVRNLRPTTTTKRLQQWCFPVKFAKVLGTPIFKNICERLLWKKLLCLQPLKQLFWKKKIKLTNLCKISRKAAYIDPSQTPSFFAKMLKAVNFFSKSSILDVWLVSKYAFGRFCTECFTKETSHCSR